MAKKLKFETEMFKVQDVYIREVHSNIIWIKYKKEN